MKKGPGLRKRFSKFFTGPHSASLEPRRIVNAIPPHASAPNYLLIKLPDHTQQPNTLEHQPFDASPNQRMFLDGSNPANYTGVGKHGNAARSRDALTGHHLFNIRRRLFARPSPSVAPPLGRRRPQLPAVDNTTHNGESIRSSSSDDLYRKAPRRHGPRSPQSRRNRSLDDLSTQEQLPQQLSGEQEHDTASHDREDDWPHWYWPATTSNPLKTIPAFNVGARQLALLNPGHRGGVIISNSITPPAESILRMTTMDMENASREWRQQHQSSGSVADANAEFGLHSNVEENTKHLAFSFSHSLDISPPPHDSALPFQAASRSSSYYSARGLDAADTAARQRKSAASSTLPRAMRSTSLPLLLTGSDIIRAAAADPEVDETPMAFRAYFENEMYNSAGEGSHEQYGGRMVSMRQAQTPLPQFEGEGKAEHENKGRFQLEYEYESADSPQGELNSRGQVADNLKTAPVDAMKEEISRTVDLSHTLKDERDGLLQQNYVLLAAAGHARDLLQGAEEAYDALEEQAGKRIAELEGECARLREENDQLTERLNSAEGKTAG
jgi:hypothetical protein